MNFNVISKTVFVNPLAIERYIELDEAPPLPFFDDSIASLSRIRRKMSLVIKHSTSETEPMDKIMERVLRFVTAVNDLERVGNSINRHLSLSDTSVNRFFSAIFEDDSYENLEAILTYLRYATSYHVVVFIDNLKAENCIIEL